VTRWTVCVLLFLATTLNYLDRQTLSILAPFLQKDLGLNNEHLGWLFSVFYWSYTVAQFGVGVLLDRTHLRWTYGVGVLLWSLVAALTSLATGFGSFILFRLLLGLTESVNWPAAMRIVARTLPPAQRSLGNGIFTSGTSIGALIAPVTILSIAGQFGWRWSFVVVGSLGVVWFVLWLLFTRDRNLAPVWRETKLAAVQSVAQAYRGILSSAQFWRVFVVSILVNPCLYFNLNWLPTYFVQQRGLGTSDLAGVLTVIYLGLDLGYLFCGAAVLLLTRHGISLRTARTAVFSVATVLLACTALVPFTVTVKQGVSLFVAANFGAGIWIAMYLTMAQEVSTVHVSTAAGLLGGSGSAAGALAMWAVGRVTHITGSFSAPLTAVAAVAFIAAIAGRAAVRHAGPDLDKPLS
jgi:MFS transporter, ACS family, hexuronate transporter